MTDREFAIKVRRLLLAVVALIEQYYKLGKHAEPEYKIQEVSETDNTTFDIVVK